MTDRLHSAEDLVLGTVARLRRYPVKSMLGEDVTASDVTGRGLDRDRRLALIHRTAGKVASAKNPRLWRGLLTLAAATVDSAVRISLPDGKAVWSTDPDVDAVLSRLLDQPVVLTDAPPGDALLDRAEPAEVLSEGVTARVPVRMIRLGESSPPGTFFDFAPVHLITTSTLGEIAALSPRGTVETERYRPNVLIRTPAPGFTENDWVGRDLRIGGELVLRVVARTPRCAIPTLVHGELPRDTAALRVLAEHNRLIPMESFGPEPCAGAYAEVLHPGRIGLGDVVRLA